MNRQPSDRVQASGEPSRRQRLKRLLASKSHLLRLVGGTIGLGFLLVILWETWGELVEIGIPSVPQLVSSQLLTIRALALGAEAWACLLGSHFNRAGVLKGFYASQLGKYVPGLIWQPLSQVGLAVTAGVPIQTAAVAFPVHALIQVAAAGTIGAVLALVGDHLDLALRAAALAGLLSVLLLRRRWMAWALDRARRWIPKVPSAASIPRQAAIVRSYLWSITSLALTGVAFSILLPSLTLSIHLIVTTSAFALAWVVGFVAVFFPSGIGVREGVLLIAVPAIPAAILAASIGLRLLWVIGELILIVAATGTKRFLDHKRRTTP